MKNVELVSVASVDENDLQSYRLRSIFTMYLYHWPLFLIGILACCSGGVLYMKKVNPLYNVNATVIIKDNKTDPNNKSDLQELSLTSSSKLVENEIEVLGARNLLLKVVSDLKLWIDYRYDSAGSSVDLYQRNPVEFVLLSQAKPLDKLILKVKVENKNFFSIENKDGSSQELSFKGTFHSSFGDWKLIPNDKLIQYVNKSIKIFVNDKNRITEEYQKNIKIEMPNKLASIISLSLKDEVDQRGKDFLNALIDNYNKTSINEKNRITKRTLDFIDDRVRSLAEDLDNSERNIEGYRSKRGITDISSQSKVYLENVQFNDNKLNEVNVQLNVLQGIDKYLSSNENTLDVPSTLGISEPVLNNSIQKLSQLQLERQKLLATTPETNPEFEPINRQIKTTKSVIRENIANIKSSLILTKKQLESFNSKYESSIRDVPVRERQLVDKTRQQSIKENLYVYLLQKREEVALNYSSILADAQIVDYAYSDTKKSRKPVVFGIAFFLALALPAGFIHGRNLLSNRVGAESEIEKETGLSVFAEVVQSNLKTTLVTLEKEDILICEDFRKLRVSLNQLKGKLPKGFVTLVTSSVSNEGKSFVGANLGHFLASSGKKTVIVDMDLKRPKMLSIFNLSNSDNGVISFLEGQQSLINIIQKSKMHPYLDVVGCSRIPASSSELLESDKVKVMLDELRTRYDHVIIDTPPMNLVTDAKLLAGLSDCILYIIRQGYTPKPLLRFIKSLKKIEKFTDMKIVFNGVAIGRYGYRHNYGNDYYQSISGSANRSFRYIFNNFLGRF